MADVPRSHRQFFRPFVVVLVVFLAGALLSPPDPFTQVRLVALALVVAMPLAALLAYGGGYDRLHARFRT